MANTIMESYSYLGNALAHVKTGNLKERVDYLILRHLTIENALDKQIERN
jgi:hypothetical protein